MGRRPRPGPTATPADPITSGRWLTADELEAAIGYLTAIGCEDPPAAILEFENGIFGELATFLVEETRHRLNTILTCLKIIAGIPDKNGNIRKL